MNVESFTIDNWDDQRGGIILAENDDWLLVMNASDYNPDGYSIYKKEFLKNRMNGEEERLVERVVYLKNINPIIPDGFEFSNTLGHLKWCQDKYGVFEFQDDDDAELFYGRINRVMDNSLMIDFIDSKGNIDTDYDYEFDLNQIRVISFGSAYFEAIRLLWLDKQD